MEAARRAGIGRLYEMFLQLRDKLAGEGLFAHERKRPLPLYPRRIAIITSSLAAALHDVIATLRRRAPHVELILYPTLVQGTDAPAAIVSAIDQANARRECDLLLLVRGGGSLEDLWAFNDEAVARALSSSTLPTISGVGHETDTTIVDFIADQRAATPTASAELASAGWFAAASRQNILKDALQKTLCKQMEYRMQALDRLSLRLIHPARRLASARQRLEMLAHRLKNAGDRRSTILRPQLENLRLRLVRQQPNTEPTHRQIALFALRLSQGMHTLNARRHDSVARHAAAFAALSPLATLERGYSIVRNGEGDILRSSAILATGSRLDIRFASGSASVRVESIDKT